MANDVQDLSLPLLFRRAEAIFLKLQDSPGPAASQTQLITDAIAYLTRAASLVDSLGLFSSNEDKDDLATGDMKYLLIPYYHAELLAQQQFNNNPEGRLTALKQASRLHEAFLARAQQYELLSVTGQSLVSSTENGAKLDPTTLRQMKIEKFKLEKSIKTRVEALERQLNGKNDQEDGDLEIIERESAILKIEAASLKSMESLRSVRQEIEVLQHATSLTKEETEAQRATHQPPEDLLIELRKAAGALKIGSTAAQREELQRNVFKPSYIMPTMTVEQQGEIEIAQLLAQQRAEEERKQQAAALRAAKGRKGDDSDAEDDDDEKIQRQRAMDDWKDDNPRGWGNSKLRPCG